MHFLEHKNSKTSGVLLCVAITFLCAISEDEIPTRYSVILEKAPFGAIPQNLANEDSLENSSETELSKERIEEIEKEQKLLSEKLKLTAITSFNGVKAAGITEKKTGRTFYLTVGQNIVGYNLIDIDTTNNCILLEADDVIGNLALSFAPGQATNIVINPSSGKPSVLDIYKKAPISTTLSTQSAVDTTQETPQNLTPDSVQVSDSLVKKATFTNKEGSQQISFRELHRLRVQENKAKVEEAIRIAKEKELKEKQEKENIEKLLQAEEKQKEKEARQAVIDGIIDGTIVPDKNYEFTSEELQTLSDAGVNFTVDNENMGHILNEQNEELQGNTYD